MTTSSSGSDIHFSALCNAIEHEKLEKAKAILETHPSLLLDVANNDGFTPLDLAFMTGNQDMLRLLINHRHDDNSGRYLNICTLKLTKIEIIALCRFLESNSSKFEGHKSTKIFE